MDSVNKSDKELILNNADNMSTIYSSTVQNLLHIQKKNPAKDKDDRLKCLTF